MLDIFFEALNYETIEQKKAYEVAGLLGEHCGLVAVPRALVGTLQCGPVCCHPNPGAPGCAHSVGSEQSTPRDHSSDEFCPFSALPASSALLTAFLSPPGDIGGQMGLFIGASILTVLELFDYAYEVSPKMLCPIPVGSAQPPWHRVPPPAGGAPLVGSILELRAISCR